MEDRLAPLLLFLAICLILNAPSAAASGGGTDSSEVASPPKVVVELYSEALCPGCSDFTVNRLSRFFVDGLIDIVDLRIIPFGNARLNITTGKFICQHGPDECKLNIIQTCAIKTFPLNYEWFPFIYCLEALPSATAASIWKRSCGGTIRDVSLVEECYKGPIGLQLEKEFAKLTNALEPPHEYVPWVLVNGEPLYEDFDKVELYVCRAYGGPKPNACNTAMDDKLEAATEPLVTAA